MRAAVVAECNPVPGYAHRTLDAVEAVSLHALLRERPDEALDHAILLRAVRRD